MLWIGKLKQYGYLILSGLLAFSALLLRIFFLKSQRVKREAEVYKAKAEKAREIAEDDVKTEMDHESRSAKVAKEIEENGHTDELSKPNEW